MQLELTFSTLGPWRSGIRDLELPMDLTLDLDVHCRIEPWEAPGIPIDSSPPRSI